MGLSKLPITLFILFSLSAICFAQRWSEPEDNWLLPILDSECASAKIQYEYRSFDETDVVKAKIKFNSIWLSPMDSEWEGVYDFFADIGVNRIVWSNEGGFLELSCYHVVRRLDYGDIETKGDYFQFKSHRSFVSELSWPNRYPLKDGMVPVKFGDVHVLVYKSSIRDFLEVAAGWNNGPSSYYYHWTKLEDSGKSFFGTPKVPAKFRHLIRKPIVANITGIGQKQTVPAASLPDSFEVNFPITLDTGSKAGIRVGMVFFVDDLVEWVEVTKVSGSTSVGMIQRFLYEDGSLDCRDAHGSHQLAPCKEIKVGMKARTKSPLIRN